MIEKTTDKAIVIPFQDERDMLMKYLELYESINPTKTLETSSSGYNFDTALTDPGWREVLTDFKKKRKNCWDGLS